MLRPAFRVALCASVAFAALTSFACSERRPSQLATPPADGAAPRVEETGAASSDTGVEASADAGTPQAQKPRRQRWPVSTVVLDGEPTQVSWSDGDTFRILSGPHAKTSARLHGYNTLEDYGPVHRWGEWTAKELLGLAKAAGERVRKEQWTCQSQGEKDGYNRLLVKCDDAGLALVREGLALIFSVDGPAPEAWQKAQAQARAEKVGMWAKGTPSGIVTSLHSASEGGDKGEQPYNRVVDARTGHAQIVPHADTYEVCQEVCLGKEGDTSCMVYVPFERRYRDRAPCLQ